MIARKTKGRSRSHSGFHRIRAGAFPFKTKGILLASSRYENLDRDRVRIHFDSRNIEGILDGGHNTLAIGLLILKRALDFTGGKLPRGQKT